MANPVLPPPADPRKFDSQVLTNWFDGIRAPASTVPPPATSTSAGIAGQIAYDATFLYICVAANTWKRVPLGAF